MIDFDFEKMEFVEDNSSSNCIMLQFLKNTSGVDKLCLLNKLAVIGYLAVPVKDESCPRAVLVHGPTASGKSLFAAFFDYISNVTKYPANSPRIKGYNWSLIYGFTRIVCIDGVPREIIKSQVEFLFPCITGDWMIERYGRCTYSQSFKESPKILITTHNALDTQSISYTARLWNVGFNDYYNKHKKPIDDFGCLLYTEWDTSEWLRCWELVADCIKIYIKYTSKMHELNLFRDY